MSKEKVEIENENKYNKKNSFCKRVFLYLATSIYLFAFLVIFFIANYKTINDNIKQYISSLKIDKGEWIVVDDEMSKTRSPATANLLPDGNVLIMGGEDDSADTADIFDPKQMKIVKTIKLEDKRYSLYSVVSLKNGDVYISGGYLFNTMPPNITNSAKIFDAKTYSFRNVKNMDKRLGMAESVLLNNGNIIIFDIQSPKYQIYNPNKNEYYYPKNAPYAAASNTKNVILEDGKILLFSGSSYIYDPQTNLFKKTKPQMPIGTWCIQLDENSYLNLLSTFDYTYGYTYYIKENKEIPVKNHINRAVGTGNAPILVKLLNGNVLIMNINTVKRYSETQTKRRYSSFLYSKEKNMFFQIPNPPYPMSRPGIVMLSNGDILFAGGRSDRNGNKIQIYRYKH